MVNNLAQENLAESVELSIIIVTYNVSGCLKKCIDSIYKNSGIESLEIIIIDNASQDDTVGMIRSNYPGVKLIENESNIYVPKSDNHGIRIAKGRYVLMLNPDVIILPGSLKSMLNFLKDNPAFGAVGPRLVNEAGDSEHCVVAKRGFQFFLFNYTFLKKIFKKKVGKINQRALLLDWRRDTDRDAEVMVDICLMTRRSVLKETGLYDEAFKLYFVEDDLCNRIIEHGYKIHFLSSVSNIHFQHKSVSQIDMEELIKIYRQDAYVYARKYFGFIRANFLVFLMVLTRKLAHILKR